MPLNDACPEIRVEPDTFKVWVDGDEIVPDPVLRAAARPALLAVLAWTRSRCCSRTRASRRGPTPTRSGSSRRSNDGLTDVPAFMPRRLRLVAEADARFAVEARRVPAPSTSSARARRGVGGALPEPGAARGRAAARRAAAALGGDGLARRPDRGLPRRVAAHAAADRARRRRRGARASPTRTSALLALYDDAATVASAALKLLPLDPAVTARWLAELAPQLALTRARGRRRPRAAARARRGRARALRPHPPRTERATLCQLNAHSGSASAAPSAPARAA